MKSILTVLIVILSFSASAQHTFQSKKYKIAFEATQLLEQYETESERVLGYENDNYAVDIEIFPLSELSTKYKRNQKYAAFKTSNSLGLKNSKDGSSIKNIFRAYYVISEEIYQGVTTPVIVLVAINTDLSIAYEVTIYCYKIDLEEGKKVVNSFKLLD